MRSIADFKHSGTLEPNLSERERRNRALARRAAAEGMVLLKNDGLLPLHRQARIRASLPPLSMDYLRSRKSTMARVRTISIARPFPWACCWRRALTGYCWKR